MKRILRPMNNIIDLINANSTIVENELKRYSDTNGYGIEKAMEYSLMSGGKRLRPFITLEIYKMLSKDDNIEKVLPFACALEMIHTYSLIHDDLPSMDNDDFRRGKPTNHKVFGEAQALLAGDCLLTYAFKVAAENYLVSDKSVRYAIQALSTLSGHLGMAGGQMIDLDSAKNISSYADLKKMHSLKTSALIKCATLLGYYAYTDKIDEKIIEDLSKYADCVGIAFQIRDDILDKISTQEMLGKPIGSDEKNMKTTALSYMSIEEAQKEVDFYTNEAILAIEKYEGEDKVLSNLARYLVNRDK